MLLSFPFQACKDSMLPSLDKELVVAKTSRSTGIGTVFLFTLLVGSVLSQGARPGKASLSNAFSILCVSPRAPGTDSRMPFRLLVIDVIYCLRPLLLLLQGSMFLSSGPKRSNDVFLHVSLPPGGWIR